MRQPYELAQARSARSARLDETGERRLSTKADVEAAARLADALPQIDFVMSLGIASDVPGSDAYVHQAEAMIRNTEKPILFDLLGASEKTGVTLTESCAMHPGAAVSGLLISHPESRYFAISELRKDQVEDYARRKGWSLAEAEKWLGPWLGYSA